MRSLSPPSPLPLPPTEGPRERLRRKGRLSLSDAELLAILLGTGAPGQPVELLATRILTEQGGLPGLERLGMGELLDVSGIGPGKASRIVASLELGRRVATTPLSRGSQITSSREIDAALRPRLGRAESEEFLAIPVDSRNRPLAELRIALGGLSSCPVSPGDVFRRLLREAASGVFFAHNHPSGDTTPSLEDVAITERLSAAGELLGVRVLDHLIIGHEGYFSFLDAGLLPFRKGSSVR